MCTVPVTSDPAGERVGPCWLCLTATDWRNHKNSSSAQRHRDKLCPLVKLSRLPISQHLHCTQEPGHTGCVVVYNCTVFSDSFWTWWLIHLSSSTRWENGCNLYRMFYISAASSTSPFRVCFCSESTVSSSDNEQTTEDTANSINSILSVNLLAFIISLQGHCISKWTLHLVVFRPPTLCSLNLTRHQCSCVIPRTCWGLNTRGNYNKQECVQSTSSHCSFEVGSRSNPHTKQIAFLSHQLQGIRSVFS